MKSHTVSFTGAGEADAEPMETTHPRGESVDVLSGRTLGDFVVRSKLGTGGFGSVYRAEQPVLAREAVIKVIHPGLRTRADVTGRFMREARLASKLDHPFAAHIYAFGAEPDGLLWIAMELVRGTGLDRILERHGPIPPQRLVPLVERICEVVHSAHEAGIIHRDLKPANVVVISRAGRWMPKLLDFGIAKLSEDALEELEPSNAATGMEDTFNRPTGTEQRLDMAVSMHLTEEGLFVGSPHYMAPEQWRDATDVDARSDLYAIGVLTFQCLTGRVPFPGDTFRQVRDAHANDPIPKLGPGFPGALDAFFAKALAKNPEHRFANALQLSAALRLMSGLADETVQLPQLDELTRELILAEAPQPLADAVATLEGARSAIQALEHTEQLIRTVVRWSAVLALAARVRQGAGAAQDSEPAKALLTKLRRYSLLEHEWLQLGRELSLPFASQRDVHPTPELIGFFCDHDGDGDSNFESLFALAQTLHTRAVTDAAAQERLGEVLPRVAKMLRALGPLLQYQLGRVRQGWVERWTGVRRNQRAAHKRPADAKHEGQLLLTDAEGTPVLELSPLLQVMAPSPGAAEEVFFLDGNGRHGAKLRALPSGFERHDDGLWGWFGRHLFQVESTDELGPEDERPPYLGLSSFSAADAQNFFGREQEAEGFANRLRVSPLLAVVGPSGSGKSSFIQAGVLPLLPATWRTLTVRPGSSPLLALQQRLGALGGTVEGLKEKVLARPAALGDLLRTLAPDTGALVVVVDQFEELITLCADPLEREQYAEALVRAAEASGGKVRVVVTLRDDFLIRCQALPALREQLAQGLQLLGTPAREDLLRILVEPARRAGYEFESPELPAEMMRAVSDQPGALALLSFTATRLWELRDRQLKRLTRKAYQALGGVGGALAHHAEATMAAMSEPAQKLVREAFRHLVTAEGTRAILSRGDMVQLLGGGAPADEVLESLIHARLLVASEGQGGEDRVEVIHEALLISWPRLVKWQREDAEHVRMRDQVRAAARQWEERKRDRGLLWRGEALIEYRLWRPRYSGALTRTEEAFGSASLTEELRGRRLRLGLVVVAFLTLAAGMTLLYRANGRAEASASESKARLIQSYRDAGRRALLADDPNRALIYLQKTRELGGGSRSLDFMIAEVLHTLGAQRARMPGHHGLILQGEYSPDGERFATAGMDGNAGLWNARTGERLALLVHPAGVNEVHFTADSQHLITLCKDGVLRWFRASDHTLEREQKVFATGLRTGVLLPKGAGMVLSGMVGEMSLLTLPSFTLTALPAHRDLVRGMRVSSSGARVVSWSLDGTAHVYRLGTSADGVSASLERQLATGLGRVVDGDLSPDGTLLALRGDTVGAEVYDVQTGERRLLLRDSSVTSPSSLHFSPDGRWLATASEQNAAKVWDARTGELVATLPHEAGVRTVRFARDGRVLLSSSADGVLKLWSVPALAPVGTFSGNDNLLLFSVFAPDGSAFITGGVEGVARLWDAHHFEPKVRVQVAGEVLALETDAADRFLYAAGKSGHLATFDLQGPSPRQVGDVRPSGALDSAAWSRDHTLSFTSMAGALQGETADGTRRFATPEGSALYSLELSPDGTLVAAAGVDGTVGLFDARSGQERGRLHASQRELHVARFSPDGQTLLVAGWDEQAQLWDVASQKLKLKTQAPHPNGFLHGAFSPDGRRFATAGLDRKAVVWDANTGAALRTTPESSAELNYVAFSQDGLLLSVGASDGWVRIFDAELGELLGRLDKAAAGQAIDVARFTERGNLLVGNDDGEAHLWELPRLMLSDTELATYTRCRVPYSLEAGQLVQVSQPRPGCSRP